MAMALGDLVSRARREGGATDKWNQGSTVTERGIWLVLYLRPWKRGSMEQQLLALADELGRRRTPLTLVFSHVPKPWLQRELDLRGVKVHTLPFSRPYAAAMELLGQLRAARPALVHFHFLRATSPLVAAARLCGARVLVHDHITLTHASRSRVYNAIKRVRGALWSPMIDLRIAVSRVVANSVTDVERVDQRRVVTVENGIDLARFERADGAGVK